MREVPTGHRSDTTMKSKGQEMEDLCCQHINEDVEMYGQMVI